MIKFIYSNNLKIFIIEVIIIEQKIILTNAEPDINSTGDQLASVVINRLGLMPRKKGSTEKMNQILIQLYERVKEATRVHNPSKAIITVEEMGMYAGITRQTMYDYIKRWLDLDFIIKISFVDEFHKVVIGYRLNGNTIEQAFEKVRTKITNNMDYTVKYIKELQKTLKNEKIRNSANKNALPKLKQDDESSIPA